MSGTSGRKNLRRPKIQRAFDCDWPDDYFHPFERQKAFRDSTAKYRLFGGAAGPGKSTALLWEAIRQANRVPFSNTLLLRRTYPELESSLISQFLRTVPRKKYKKFNESKHVVTWLNGSTTRFGYCRSENDVYQYQGAEFLFIGIDELTHFTYKQWQFLTSRNRCPIKSYCDGEGHSLPVVPSMAGASNPGNIGHAWVKALWVDHKPPAGFEQSSLYDPGDYHFIRARIEDNPIYANDADYRRTARDSARALAPRFSGRRLECLRRAVFRHFRLRPPHNAAGRDSPGSLVAAVDFDRLGLSASQRGLLALRYSGRSSSRFVLRIARQGTFPKRQSRITSHESPVAYRHLSRVRPERPFAAHVGARNP